MTRCVVGPRARARAALLGAPSPTWGRPRAEARARCARAGATLAVSEAIAAELRAAGIPRVEVIPNVVDAEEARGDRGGAAVVPAARALPALRRQARGEQGRAAARARGGRGAHRPAAGGAGRRLAGARAEVRRRRRRRPPASCAAGRSARTCCAPRPRHRARLPVAVARAALPRAAGGARPRHAGRGHGHGRHARDPGHDGAGLVVDDAAGLADAVARLVGDDGAARAHAARRRARARAAFSPAALVPRYEAVYRRLA